MADAKTAQTMLTRRGLAPFRASSLSVSFNRIGLYLKSK